MMCSNPYYIEYTLAWIDAHYGSVMSFIREELGVYAGELSAIRAV